MYLVSNGAFDDRSLHLQYKVRPGLEAGTLRFYMGRLRPDVEPQTLTIFDRQGTHFFIFDK